MSELRASPFSLPFYTLVQTRGFAINLIGTSTASNVNTIGARIRTEPFQMTQPYFVSRMNTYIYLQWDAPTGNDTGNSPIYNYTLKYDAGTGTITTQLLESNVNNYNLTGLTDKTNYIFEIRAANIYGYGSYSTLATIKTLAVPE